MTLQSARPCLEVNKYSQISCAAVKPLQEEVLVSPVDGCDDDLVHFANTTQEGHADSDSRGNAHSESESVAVTQSKSVASVRHSPPTEPVAAVSQTDSSTQAVAVVATETAISIEGHGLGHQAGGHQENQHRGPC